MTVGDLKSELSRWSGETPVAFRSPLKEQEFRFYRYRPEKNVLVLEINEFPETSPVARCRLLKKQVHTFRRVDSSSAILGACIFKVILRDAGYEIVPLATHTCDGERVSARVVQENIRPA